MTVSNELHKLTTKAQETEQKVSEAEHQAKAELEATIGKARASMESQSTKLQEHAQGAAAKASGWRAEQQQAWNAHIEKMRQDMKEQSEKRKVKGAQHAAEDAEADAYFAIDVAYSAIEAAEYAVLDAILARKNADEVAAATA